MSAAPVKPAILLIGAGRFGRNHLRVLRDLHRRKRIRFVGVVARRAKARRALAGAGIRVFSRITPAVLGLVDAVDAVTPASTHYAVVEACLPYAHVFVEKPLALRAREVADLLSRARRHKKVLFVGHIFRFNGAVERLKEIVRRSRAELYYIEGRFTGEADVEGADCGVVASDTHLIDILDYVLEEAPRSLYCRARRLRRDCRFEDEAVLVADYRGDVTAVLKLGWSGIAKVRALSLFFRGCRVDCDLLAQRIVIRRAGGRARTIECFRREPLLAELEAFVEAVRAGERRTGEAAVEMRLAGVVEKALESARTNRVVSL